jgi:hypothetical protein
MLIVEQRLAQRRQDSHWQMLDTPLEDRQSALARWQWQDWSSEEVVGAEGGLGACQQACSLQGVLPILESAPPRSNYQLTSAFQVAIMTVPPSLHLSRIVWFHTILRRLCHRAPSRHAVHGHHLAGAHHAHHGVHRSHTGKSSLLTHHQVRVVHHHVSVWQSRGQER